MYGHMRVHGGSLEVAAALAGGSLVGLGLRMAVFALGAVLLRRLGESGAALPENVSWLDPVYTHAALRSLADLHLQGLAVGGPPGEWLHSAWPTLFADPARAHRRRARQPCAGAAGGRRAGPCGSAWRRLAARAPRVAPTPMADLGRRGD